MRCPVSPVSPLLQANTSNVASLLYDTLNGNEIRANWCGFYFMKNNELVLGPFQGKPACIRISLERGVCGCSAREKRTLLISDVHTFPGHIACDSDSQSELVVPLLHPETKAVMGVLDIDSPNLNEFNDVDREGVERIASMVSTHMPSWVCVPFL
eukprot:TRINITY_DN3967_c0_g1_i2.p1 TRINITY_DN3967_c0_g1~~TRINITY_DN3967_c0_g1_i2.p1  ORF type:complete len:155 (-),score=7.84 TRINITY_DN3967_c0_g1_i2:37-501(-)